MYCILYLARSNDGILCRINCYQKTSTPAIQLCQLTVIADAKSCTDLIYSENRSGKALFVIINTYYLFIYKYNFLGHHILKS